MTALKLSAIDVTLKLRDYLIKTNMSMNLDYHELFASESVGSQGAFGVKILVAATKLTNFGMEDLRRVAYTVQETIDNALHREVVLTDPDCQARAKVERAGLLGLFSQPIYVEEIPNGYCPRGCCAHLPWFIVTTAVGRIKLGWRKSVINIDWSETRGTKTSKELFENENVTKDERGIHAWGYEKGKAYIDAILTGTKLT